MIMMHLTSLFLKLKKWLTFSKNHPMFFSTLIYFKIKLLKTADLK